MRYLVNGDEVVETFSYVDIEGDTVEIGTMVGFREEFCTSCEPGIQCPSYIVLDLPNAGNTVVMTEIVFFRDETCRYTVTDPNATLEVEPWKIGAI
jgi:hypothetical protein